MKTDRLLIKNGIVVTLGEKNRVLYGHAVLCEDGLIKRVAPQKELETGLDNEVGKSRTGPRKDSGLQEDSGTAATRVIDARGKVVMPGFINAHMHFYSTMARGLGKAKPSREFREVLENLWWRLDKKLTLDDCYYSALLPLVASVRRGTTTLIDHHASPFSARGSLNRIAEAVKEVGLRACLCYELSDRDGAKVAQDGIEENVDFVKRCQTEQDEQLRALFGLHASFTITDATMARAAEAGHALGSGFHVHTAEAKSDQDFNEKNFGMRVVERLHKYGILGPKTICAHCVHVNEREMDLLKETQTAVAHNPQSNMNNAVGVADVVKMFEKGILVGLGTDAMTVNMLEEVRTALWAQHLAHNNPSVGFVESLSTLMFNNAWIANRYWDPGVGEIKEGYAADIILMDYYPPTPFDEGTFLGHLAFGLSQAFVDTTICAGKVLMEGRQLKLDLDEEEIAAKSLELSTRLWKRF